MDDAWIESSPFRNYAHAIAKQLTRKIRKDGRDGPWKMARRRRGRSGTSSPPLLLKRCLSSLSKSRSCRRGSWPSGS